eukprot:scaffold85943_cov15-Tisochrysis_lutea.AAC.1
MSSASSSGAAVGHSLPQLSPSYLSRELQGQHSGQILLQKTPYASLPAERPASGPVCEGLDVPTLSKPSHQTGSFHECSHCISSDDEEDKRSSNHEDEGRSSNDEEEKRSSNDEEDEESSEEESDNESGELWGDECQLFSHASDRGLADSAI